MTNGSDDKFHLWIEDGILFSEYVDTMSTPEILEREKIAVEMLNKANIKIIPLILILTNVNKSRFTIKLSEYGQIVTAFGFMPRVSRIWAVGVPEDLKNYVLPMIGTFFGKHFYFASSLEQAKAEAAKFISHPSALLE